MTAGGSKARVLILCTGNSARSQIAEGLLRRVGGGQYEVFSAGTRPVGVNPLAVDAMRELGIDISAQRSKSVAEFAGEQFATVITVCDNAAEECPVFPGAPERVHWSLRDPAAVSGTREEKLAAFREIRDDLERRIREFVSSAASGAPAA
ncbi:MAG TPA: arsenate reductase ArsC [Candidatus Saccharimonadales bacterium]|jgi:arsenate reductase|nr:arsenate reductase ArsC [Candidatus Saccharimonadales bacterium]